MLANVVFGVGVPCGSAELPCSLYKCAVSYVFVWCSVVWASPRESQWDGMNVCVKVVVVCEVYPEVFIGC